MIRTTVLMAALGSGMLSIFGTWAQADVLVPQQPQLVAQSVPTVRMGSLQPYTHPSGLLSARVPTSWDFEDLSDDEIIRVGFSDPFGNALFLLAAFESSVQFTPGQLGVLLQDDVESLFATYDDFVMSPDPIVQSDGSLRVTYAYFDEASSGAYTEFLGNSFIEQRGNMILLTYMVTPQAQFNGLSDSINAMLNSVSVNP